MSLASVHTRILIRAIPNLAILSLAPFFLSFGACMQGLLYIRHPESMFLTQLNVQGLLYISYPESMFLTQLNVQGLLYISYPESMFLTQLNVQGLLYISYPESMFLTQLCDMITGSEGALQDADQQVRVPLAAEI